MTWAEYLTDARARVKISARATGCDTAAAIIPMRTGEQRDEFDVSGLDGTSIVVELERDGAREVRRFAAPESASQSVQSHKPSSKPANQPPMAAAASPSAFDTMPMARPP